VTFAKLLLTHCDCPPCCCCTGCRPRSNRSLRISFDRLMTLTSSTTLPELSGRHYLPRQAGQPLVAIKKATCYVNAVVQAVVHVPAVANLRVQDWRKGCGCKPDSKGFCTLCYLGIRVQSSFGKGPETAAKKPLGMLQRLHLLGGGFIGSILNSRRKAPAGKTTQVRHGCSVPFMLLLLALTMHVC